MTRGLSRRRDGFSLIELLVVIAIITILSGLTLAGISRVRIASTRAQAMADINALSTGISNFKAKFGNVPYIPTNFTLKKTYGSGDPEVPYLKRLFPQINIGNTGYGGVDVPMSNNQSLLFFLTGGVGTSYTGFSTNRQQPFSMGGDRIGPFMDVLSKKCVRIAPSDKADSFIDPWGTPYAYFTSINGNDYSGSFSANSTTVSPFTEGGRFVMQKSFQIICAGPDQKFGPGGDYTGTNAGAYTGGVGRDDMGSFSQAGNLSQ